MHFVTGLQCNILEAWMSSSDKKSGAFSFFHFTKGREWLLTSGVLGASMGCWKLSWWMCFYAGMSKGCFQIWLVHSAYPIIFFLAAF